MTISGTKGQWWIAIPTQYRKASDILTSTLSAFFIQQRPKKGKGSRVSFKLLHQLITARDNWQSKWLQQRAMFQKKTQYRNGPFIERYVDE